MPKQTSKKEMATGGTMRSPVEENASAGAWTADEEANAVPLPLPTVADTEGEAEPKQTELPPTQHTRLHGDGKTAAGKPPEE